MKFNSKYTRTCSQITCIRQDGITCPDDSCDIEQGVIRCTCADEHPTPVWHCRVHGDTAVDAG